MGIRRLLKFSEVFGPGRSLPEYVLDSLSRGLTSARPAATQPAVQLRRGTSDWRVYRKVFVEREYDIDYGGDFDLIIDAGANAGYAAVFYAQRFPAARVIAIEPDLDNFLLLQQNTRAYPQIECLHGALWHQNTPIRIANPEAPKWAFRVGEAPVPDGHTVPAFTMTELLARQAAERVLFKCDIEGAESAVFRHSAPWIGQIDAIICELHERLDADSARAFHIATQGFPRHLLHGENSVVLR